ncbi:MAG: hypothetical protein OEY89_05115 [Gammaproteobacteria bacterium]|nr:hypothetical protein [Gammaproteobacteria bacterium]
MKTNKNVARSILISLFTSLMIGCGNDDDPYRVVLGTNNFLVKATGNLQYQLPFVVQVTNIDGTPASHAPVTFTIKALDYRKGYYIKTDTSSPPDSIEDAWRASITATCNIEDSNSNGTMDAGEDNNGNGILDPTNPATISAHSSLTPTIDNTNGKLITDENGYGYFVMSYPPSEAYWVRIQMTAIADGNSEPEVYETVLPALESDLSNINITPPGGVYGKYGLASVCTDPN